MIRLLRVDDRLLHGQVSFAWTDYLKLKRIVIVNDEAARDSFTKTVLELSMPKEVRLDILMLEEFEGIVKELLNEEDNSIVIVGSLFDAKKTYELIKKYSYADIEINIGGLRNRPNAININEYVYLTKEDINIIYDFLDHDYVINVKRMPSEANFHITDRML